MAKTLY